MTKINNPEMVMATDRFARFAPPIWSTGAEPDSTQVYTGISII